MDTPQIEVLAEGLAFPEGPVVLADGSVLVVEIRSGVVTRVWGNGRSETVARPGGGPNGAALGPDGALYVCNNGGMDPQLVNLADGAGRIERIDLATGRVERLYERAGERRLSAPNDLVFDRTGGFWFTDLGRTLADHTEFGGLYYARPDGSAIVEHQYGPFSYNGVGLSPDERTVYVAETRTARLWAYELEAPGQIARAPGDAASRSRRRLVGTSPGNVSLDSLAVTAAGTVCVGTLGHGGTDGGISSFTPDNQVQRLSLPDRLVTNIAFGGPDLRDACLTLSMTGRLARLRWPEPGLKLNFAA